MKDSKKEPKHCDDYINDFSAPKVLRWFLFINRLPAIENMLCREMGVKDPKLFATYQGKRVRVVMASRFGDVGITRDLLRDYGYSDRVAVEELTEFSDKP